MASILVIDDYVQIRSFMRNMLEAEGHEVRMADDGKAALRLYRQERPDLVFCDLFMPEKEGIETIRELIGHDPQAKVVAMSGGSEKYGPLGVLPVAQVFGAVATLAKPFDAVALSRMVREALRTTD